MNRSGRKSKRLITAILVMLALCIVSAAYIVIHTRNNAALDSDIAEEEVLDTLPDETSVDDEAVAAPPSRVYANRGTSDEEKFSAEAYDSAVKAGAGYIVLPFVVSADGTPYVTDDDNTDEMTGYSGYLSGMTDSQVAELRTRGGNSFLKLSDVFDKYGSDVRYVIEIRYTSARNIDAFIDTVKQYELEDQVTVSSQYYAALRKADSEFPEMQKLFLCGTQEDFNAALNLQYVDIISVEKSLMNDENCRTCHDKDKEFGVWTLNTDEEIRSAINAGADSYFTDEAALAVGVEKEAS